MERPHIPSFSEWNYYVEVPVMQTGMVQDTSYDLFYVCSPVKRDYQCKQRSKKSGLERHYTRKAKVKQRNEVRREREVAVNPMDEDLYKIPPELLYEKPRRKSFVSRWLTGCFKSLD